ncbi:MAG: hypothetical protein M1383_04345 [Patescibacteria group bacterium]|nr:hypothetical protein [Patescibacteria group bacterium]
MRDVQMGDVLRMVPGGYETLQGEDVELLRGEILEVVCEDGRECGGEGSCKNPMGSYLHLGDDQFVRIKVPTRGAVAVPLLTAHNLFREAMTAPGAAFLRVIAVPFLAS